MNFVRQQNVDEIAFGGRFGDRQRFKPVADCQIVVRTSFALSDDHVQATVPQVLSLCMALRTIAENGNRLVFEE